MEDGLRRSRCWYQKGSRKPPSRDLRDHSGKILDLLKAAFSREAKQLYHSLGKHNPKGLVLLNSMRLADIFSDDSNFRSFFMTNIILDLLKAAFGREAKQLYHSLGKHNPKGLVLLNSMRLADIFSDDSNFRSFFMTNITKVLAEILAMPHEEFFSSWCSTDVPMVEEDAILDYDPFVSSGIALASCTDNLRNTLAASVLNEADSVCPASLSSMPPISYAQQRTSYLVKIIANLHCFVPNICEEEEKDQFLNRFHECL